MPGPRRVEDMGIDYCGPHVLMAGQFLDSSYVVSVLHGMGARLCLSVWQLVDLAIPARIAEALTARWITDSYAL